VRGRDVRWRLVRRGGEAGAGCDRPWDDDDDGDAGDADVDARGWRRWRWRASRRR